MSSGEQALNVFWVDFNTKMSNIQHMPLERFLRLKIQYEQYYNTYKYAGVTQAGHKMSPPSE